jgi:hypothetical protein
MSTKNPYPMELCDFKSDFWMPFSHLKILELKSWKLKIEKKITQDSKDFEDSLKDKVAEIDPVLIKEFTIAEDKEFLTYN